ncbi:MAG: GerW family sporulation protein [Myxococcota bacterium]
MELDDLVSSLMKQLYRVSNSESVVGKPMKFADSAVVPLCKISVGFGTGSGDVSGEDTKKGGAIDVGGAGGGLAVEPRAFVVVGKGGQAQMLSVRRGARAILQRAIDVLPDTVNQVLPAKDAAQKEAAQKKAKE